MSLPQNVASPAMPGGGSMSGGPPSGSPAPGGPSKPTYSKRGKITIVACVNCRRRKTKCDGQRPVCSQCAARDGTQCHYDMNEEQRRLTYLRENVEHLADEKNHLENLITNLKISPEAEAIEILRRLRDGTDPHALAQNIQIGRTLTQVSRSGPEVPTPAIARAPDIFEQLVVSIGQAPPAELEEILRRVRLHEDPVAIVAAASSNTLLQALDGSGMYGGDLGFTDMGALRETQLSSRPAPAPAAYSALDAHGIRSSSWTGQPSEQADHALKLYFSWQHCFFQSLPQKLVLEDMDTQTSRYCSKILINAICAVGCWLAPWPELPRGTARPLDLSTLFFNEAMHLLTVAEPPSMTTVAALHILACAEGNRGRMSRAWDLCGRSARMALDLGLHLRDDRPGIDENERMCRIHVFWGAFVADQLISFTLGRVSQIPTTAITVELPTVNPEDDEAPWEPYGDGDKTKIPGARATTFYEVATLSKILNSTLNLFFAPTQTLNGRILLNEYDKYTRWYSSLPAISQLTPDATPHVLSLHMYYHAAILLLFRPFLKAKFTGSDVSPSEVCRQSAAAISELFDQHCQHYDSVGIYTLQLHCLLAACTIHIANIPAVASTNYFIAAVNHLHDLKVMSEWAAQSLQILQQLVQKSNVNLPREARGVLYQEAIDGALPSHSEQPSTGKRSALANPSSPAVSKKPKLGTANTISQTAPIAPMGVPTAHQPTMPPPLSSQGSTLSSQAFTDLIIGGGPNMQLSSFYAQFPPQPIPMFTPLHTSMPRPTGAQGSLEVQNSVPFDGITFEGGEAPWMDPFMGYENAWASGEGAG